MRSNAGRATDSTPPSADGDVHAWHALPAGEVLEHLESDEDGLATDMAAERLERFGPNSLRLARPISPWKILLDQFRSVVVLLLVAATIVAWLIGDPLEAAAVLAVLVINAAVGFITELRARSAMAALLRLEAPDALVLRDSKPREIDARELVPGDVIIVEAGQSVPADARLLSAAELRTDEAALTGESLPVDKAADAELTADTPLAERANLLFMATVVVAGSGKAVVVATGMETEVGHIGGLVGGIREESTPLENRLDALGRQLVWLTLLVAAAVVGVGWWRGELLGRMIETGLALAIAAVPEGLPAVSTVALAVGVARMARRNALVRRLPAVEALGSATTVCSDKTGTLTAGEMTVTSLWTAGREFRVSGVGYRKEGSVIVDAEAAGEGDRALDEGARPGEHDTPPFELALRIAALTNRASLEADGDSWKIRGDPTEAALLVAAAKAGLDRDSLLDHWPELGSIPFSSERMLMATFHGEPAKPLVYVKGAPTHLLDRSTRLLSDSGVVALDDTARAEVSRRNEEMASAGLRVLAVAEGTAENVDEAAIRDLTFVGLFGMSDPPAGGVKETIQLFHGAGIRIIMITGDQRLTAGAVARELGILGPDDEVVEGRELNEMSPDELARRAAHITALSRVSPEDKLRIIEALQRRGEVVAMLGDGVNDAPALKRADIGVAMGGRGTDVAKEAAAVVLEDDRFQTIGVAVEQGRVIFDNIHKFVFYLFSCNLAEILVILGANLLGMGQPLFPLQILWLNLVTDTFPALSLAMEPAEPEVMKRPPRNPKDAILSTSFVGWITAYALLITVVTLAAFSWSGRDGGADPSHAVTIAFMTLALAQIFHLGTARTRDSTLGWARATSNRWALGAVILTILLQFLAVYLPPLARVLRVVPLTIGDWLLIIPLALIPAVAGQAVAWIRRRRAAG